MFGAPYPRCAPKLSALGCEGGAVMMQSTPESAQQIRQWEGPQVALSKALQTPVGYTTNQSRVVVETLPVLPHQYIYNAVGPGREDYSKHSVSYRCSLTLRYPGCLLPSSSYPFSVWTSSRDRLLFALHGNVARSVPSLAEPFVPLSCACIMAPFIFSNKRGKRFFSQNCTFVRLKRHNEVTYVGEGAGLDQYSRLGLASAVGGTFLSISTPFQTYVSAMAELFCTGVSVLPLLRVLEP